MRGKTAIWLLFLACLTGSGLRAQHYVGVRGGYGGGQIRTYPLEEKGIVWGLYSGGVSWKYYSNERYVGGVQADVEFLQRAYLRKYSYWEDTMRLKGNDQRYINSVMTSLIWQPHFYFFQRTTRVFLNAGFTISYNINSRTERIDAHGTVLESAPYQMTLTRDNLFGYGLMGGAGLGFLFGRFEVMAEGRYHFGYADILKNRNKYEANPLRSPIDNINVSIGVYYRLGQGGILSPPGKRVAEKMQQKAEQRAEGAKPDKPDKQKKRKPDAETIPQTEAKEALTIDSLKNDSLRIDSLKIDSLRMDKLKMDSLKMDSLKMDSLRMDKLQMVHP